MIPGPLFLYTVSEALHRRHWVGLKIALGHLMLEACFVAVVLVGLREWLASAAFHAVVNWVGGLGLIIMGALILMQVRRLSLARHAEVSFRWGPWVGGACFSLASPGFLIWWATIGASVVLQGLLAGLAGLALVLLGHALADLAWHWFVAFSVERGKASCSDRTYRVLMTGLAFWLIVLGAGLPFRP